MSSTVDRRTLLSTLWIFVILNYLFADVFVLIFDPGFYEPAVAQTTEGMELGFAALIAILIAMVLLSRILPWRANRWANIVAGLFATAWVASTLWASPPAHYVLFGGVEMAATLFIAGYAWTWRSPEDRR